MTRPLQRWLQAKPAPTGHGLSYRYLARQIETDLPVTDGGRTVLISSTVPLELSNEACLMFAHFLATELGRRVLLIDGTFGDQGVGSALGHAGAPGFVDTIYGAAFPLSELVVPTARENVFLLPSGRTNMTHLLPIDTAQVSTLFAEVRRGYAYALVQQGPIFAESRYLQFTSRADMVLMLVDEGGTPVDELNRCLEVFRSHQVNNVRLILSVPR